MNRNINIFLTLEGIPFYSKVTFFQVYLLKFKHEFWIYLVIFSRQFYVVLTNRTQSLNYLFSLYMNNIIRKLHKY